MESRSAGGSPALLPIRASWLLLGFAALLVGYALTTTGVSIITAEPVVPAPPPGQQRPKSPPGTETSETETTSGTTETTGTTTEESVPETPETTGTGPGGGTDGETGTQGWAPQGEPTPPFRPVTESGSGTQLNPSGAVPMWIGLGTQLIGMVTAGLSCLAAWAKVKPSAAGGRPRSRTDRRRRL